jgi:hypothetical protein
VRRLLQDARISISSARRAKFVRQPVMYGSMLAKLLWIKWLDHDKSNDVSASAM